MDKSPTRKLYAMLHVTESKFDGIDGAQLYSLFTKKFDNELATTMINDGIFEKRDVDGIMCIVATENTHRMVNALAFLNLGSTPASIAENIIEIMIDATPTGKRREKLTDINILMKTLPPEGSNERTFREVIKN